MSNTRIRKKNYSAKSKQFTSNTKSEGGKLRVNGGTTGPLTFRLDSCLNCETPLGNGTTKVAEFMLSFSETSKRTFSVMEALTAIFNISDSNTKRFPMLTSKNLVMCPNCATVLANLYKSYVELMQLSKSSANICKLIAKAEDWHAGKLEFLTNPLQSSEEDGEDEDDEDSESDGDVAQPSIKKERIDSESEEQEDDDDADDLDYGSKKAANGTKPSVKGRGSGKRKIRKISGRAQNGTYEDDSDEEYQGPRGKRKFGSSSRMPGSGCVDRSRIRERIALALDGTPRKRIRRRPSQTREDDYKCLECDRIFKFECRLIKHMKTHVDKQVQQCNLCSKTFMYSWMLENHILGDHENIAATTCEVCGLIFYRNDIYENHFCTPKDQQEAERAEKPHWCQLCGKSFQKLAHLTLHLRSHEDEKPLNCPNCSQKFKYEKCLMKHMVVHDQEHMCPLCQKVFPLKSKLNSHLQTHDVEKTYPCPEPDCEKIFKQALALQRHIRIHNGEPVDDLPDLPERHPCGACNKTFTRKSDLSRHIRNQVCTRTVIKKEEDPLRDDSKSSDDEYIHKQDGDAGGGESDGDSMSPGVSNSDNDDNPSLPSSPSPPPSPNLNLSEEDSNPSPPPVTNDGNLITAVKSRPVPEDSFLSDKDSN